MSRCGLDLPSGCAWDIASDGLTSGARTPGVAPCHSPPLGEGACSSPSTDPNSRSCARVRISLYSVSACLNFPCFR